MALPPLSILPKPAPIEPPDKAPTEVMFVCAAVVSVPAKDVAVTVLKLAAPEELLLTSALLVAASVASFN
jgi:hypothetical protein